MDDNWPHAPLTENVCLTAVFYRASRQVVDADNLLKHLMDSAGGILWINDCQVTMIVAELRLDRESPRTEFMLELHDTDLTRDYSS